jgi:hypothetical protein
MTCLRLPAIALLALAWALPAVSDPAGQWGDFESVRLHVTQAGSPALDSYLQSSHSNQDFQLDFADPQQPEHGVIMMVAGRVMLVRGLKLTAGSELAALDQPLLMYGLVTSAPGSASRMWIPRSVLPSPLRARRAISRLPGRSKAQCGRRRITLWISTWCSSQQLAP